jgi:prepilin-type N-terminal cleavage/methylation domain-containing protein
MNNRGFTLLEIAMVTAIFGIMAAIAIIKYQKITATTELDKTANNLYSELRSARSLSFKWDAPVIIKFYAQQCSIYVDTNNNGRDPSDILNVFSIPPIRPEATQMDACTSKIRVSKKQRTASE